MTSDLADYKIILYRILGNDLPPRHRIGQTYDNLKFTLDYEANFPHCQKRWIVNRIVDIEAEKRIIALLEKYKQPYIRIPFNFQEYEACKGRGLRNYLSVIKTFLSLLKSRKKIHLRFKKLMDMWKYHIRFDFEKYNKIIYVMNNNGARNLALRDGKTIADWILPFDGNCFFTEEGFRGAVDKLTLQQSTDKCFVVPMYRLKDNEDYLDFHPERDLESEPQVIVGKNSSIEFNKYYFYGYFSKIELFQKLGFQLKLTSLGILVTDSAYKCGYVLRLSSGNAQGDSSMYSRSLLRKEGINALFQKLNGRSK